MTASTKCEWQVHTFEGLYAPAPALLNRAGLVVFLQQADIVIQELLQARDAIVHHTQQLAFNHSYTPWAQRQRKCAQLRLFQERGQALP